MLTVPSITPTLRQRPSGLVPPPLLDKLGPIVFFDWPGHVPGGLPCYSVECEEVFQVLPISRWKEIRAEYDALRLRRAELRAALAQQDERARVEAEREIDLLEFDISLVARGILGAPPSAAGAAEPATLTVSRLAPSPAVVLEARVEFTAHAKRNGWETSAALAALREFAVAGRKAAALSSWWPEEARCACAKDALVRVDWVIERLQKEKDETGSLASLAPYQHATNATASVHASTTHLASVPTASAISPPRTPALPTTPPRRSPDPTALSPPSPSSAHPPSSTLDDASDDEPLTSPAQAVANDESFVSPSLPSAVPSPSQEQGTVRAPPSARPSSALPDLATLRVDDAYAPKPEGVTLVATDARRRMAERAAAQGGPTEGERRRLKEEKSV